MKSVLLATTALVAFAGAAAAEITFDGDARIGMRYDESLVDGVYDDDGELVGLTEGDSESWNVVSRARIRFTMTGETDSGLSFGARFRANEVDRISGGSNFSNTDGEVWIEGAYGRLTAGDIDSALESAVGDLPEIGVSGLNYYNEFQYTTSDYDTEFGDEFNNAGLLYEYKFGDASIYASFMDGYVGTTAEEIDGDAWALGVGYTLGDYTFGLGYESANVFIDPVIWTALAQSRDDSADVDFDDVDDFIVDAVSDNDNSTWGISGGTSWAGVTFKAIYLSTSVDGEAGTSFVDDYDVAQYGIGAEYEMANGIGLAGFYRKIDGDDIDDIANEADMYGIGASYDLGGGATLKGGIVHIDGSNPVFDFEGTGDGDFDRTTADFGVSMVF